MRFSLVVPFLNESRWLPRTLAALERQTLPATEFELLFVDNGSTDGSATIVAAYRQVRILFESRRDPYLARNRGIEAAQGEYIIFLDADCPPEPNWLEALHAAIERAPADILIGALLYPEGVSLTLRAYEAYYNQKLAWLIANGKTRHYFGHAGNMVFRREVFASCGLFKPMPIVGDTEMIHRLLAQRPDALIRFVPEACVVHAEVDSVWNTLEKLTEAGGHSQSLIPVSGYRPISLIDKLRIVAAARREQRWNPATVAMLGLMLAVGWAAFVGGRLVRRWKPGATSRPAQKSTGDRERDARH